MPVRNRLAEMHPEITAWRHDLHENPELMYDLPRTAGVVEGKLKEFGCDEVVPGIGQTGVVGVIHGRKRGSGKVIGFRADMDALPITEETGLPHASKNPGKMHACGHDGHTTMLLGAARYLAETRNFSGRVALIFQPAEEWGGGAEVMVKEGIMERFGIGQVYALHNAPGVELGRFEGAPGALMAAVDTLTVHVTGRGGHGAHPEETVDPVAAIVQMVGAFLGAYKRRVPVIVDGFIVTAAAYVASLVEPACREYMIFAHKSHESGHKYLLEELNAQPLLDLELRLGEGTGAVLAVPLVQAAAEFYNTMASFEDAGVTVP